MNKTMYALVMTLLIGMALYPLAANQQGGKTRQMRQQNVNPAEHEMTAKRAIVNQDVHITEQLCRSACMIEAGDELAAMQTITGQDAQKKLLHWRHKHPHVEYAALGPVGTAKAETMTSGQLTQDVLTAVTPSLTAAKQTVMEGKNYLSPRISAAGKTYFVFGRVAPDGKRYMVGVVNQSFVNQVADQQSKNMRLKSFPAERRSNIKTVDSDSLQPKNVTHPEQSEGASHYKINEVVVKFRTHPSEAELDKYHSDIGGKMTQKVGNIFIFKTNRMDATQLVRYFSDKNVDYVEPHFLYMTNEARLRSENGGFYGPPYPPTPGTGTPAPQAPGGTNPGTPPGGANMGMNTFEPNDTLYMKYQWNLRQIGMEAGWQANANNEVVVGIIDTGVDLSHPDLQGHLAKGLNIVTPDTPPDDDVGHGTHVAGVIAALTNNKMGVAGMTWGGRVLPVKALDSTGAGSTYSVSQGIIWATDHGAKVINMSLGNYADSNFLRDAIKYAYDRDVVLIAASGNDNTDRPSYPAYYPEVFAVAATDSDNQRASFSNYGDYVDGAAPGVSIASTYPNHQYAALSGTSMASPHVAALAAVIRSVNPSLRNTEVMDIMRKSAQDLGTPGPDYNYGSGLIDVSKAVQMAQQSTAAQTVR